MEKADIEEEITGDIAVETKTDNSNENETNLEAHTTIRQRFVILIAPCLVKLCHTHIS